MSCPFTPEDEVPPSSFPEETVLNPPMTHYDRESLFTSLTERVSYLTTFLQFTESDADTLNEAALLLEPHVPDLVDHAYEHLFKFSVTKEVFMPRAGGHEGPMVADINNLTLEADQIKERKRFFTIYIKRLITSDYNDFKTWEYYDKVGKMHTGDPGLKHRKLVGKDGLRVDHIHLSGLLGWTMDRLIVIVLRDETIPLLKRETIVRALHKVMWIQQDLFSRHYVRDGEEYQKAPRAMAGSRIRPRPGNSSTSSPEASLNYPIGDTTSDRRMGATSPTQSSAASMNTNVTGTESVNWNPQPGGSNTLSENWSRGPVSNKTIAQKTSADWSKARTRDRSMSNLEEIHAQVSASRPGLWRKIFGGS
ncbi:protoglobin protein [Rhizoctonia solani AG-3 Rhs1AP]|uniref:Protoglobin protein n=1 Tax=Rhizoctonia solani AG-3 Rhs1AP TaxID=1086054 RepID=X8J9H6_9AGAM|nr:protoglobin protein [Rhizoctonia solani AG-3 Rhs1AP]